MMKIPYFTTAAGALAAAQAIAGDQPRVARGPAAAELPVGFWPFSSREK